MKQFRIIITIFAFLLFAGQLPAELGVERLAKLGKSDRHQALLTHGVNITIDELLYFLENGFSEQVRRVGMPRDPEVKSEVYNYAIQELGFIQATKAVPQLIAIMEGEISPGLSSILALDTESYPVNVIDNVRLRFHNFVRFNAMVALGYIGDPQASVPIRHFMSTQDAGSYLLEGSVALALLGDFDGIEIMMNRFDDPTNENVDEMFNKIYVITGRNYGITPVSSYVSKQEALEKLRTWYESTPDIQVYRPDILRRRMQPPVVEQLPVSTLRGALRATKSFSDYDKRYAGRNFLRTNAKAMVNELEMISKDVTEDIDIRAAAMEWYAASEPDDAKKDLKKIRDAAKDEIIKTKAESLIEEIERLDD